MYTVQIIQDILIDFVLPAAICVVLPVMVVWFITRKKINETNRRAEIIMAAIEKNSEVSIDDYLTKMAPPQVSFKERQIKKMQSKLTFGFVLIGLGVAWLLIPVWGSMYFEFTKAAVILQSCFLGAPCLATGAGLVIGYFADRKMLERYFEREQEA